MFEALLAGIGLALAGAAVQSAGAAKVRAEAERKTRREVERQKEYERQANMAYQTSLAQSTPEVAQGAIQQGVQQRQQEYGNIANLPFSTAGDVLPASPSTVVESTRRQGEQKQLSVAQARAGGYTNWDLQQAIKNLRANNIIGVQSGLAQQSAGVLPFELNQAQHAGDTLAGIGSLLQLAGAGVGLYGAMAPAATAAAGTTASTAAPAVRGAAPLLATSTAFSPYMNTSLNNYYTKQMSPYETSLATYYAR